jgi:hypothetical protein
VKVPVLLGKLWLAKVESHQEIGHLSFLKERGRVNPGLVVLSGFSAGFRARRI